MPKCCSDCKTDIPAARLEFLPDTEYCVKCSDKHTFKSVARIIYSHKADCELFIAKSREDARRLTRVYERAR
jgi:RNA polymerase-binding transcription factor DksA